MNSKKEFKEKTVNDFEDIQKKYESLKIEYKNNLLLLERAKEEVKKSEEKFNKVFETSPDSFSITRLSDGMYVSINDGFTKVSGYTKEEIIGKTSLELNLWSNAEDRITFSNTLRKRGVIENFEAKFRNKNGNDVFGLKSASVINLEGTEYIINVTRDITERKKIESALDEKQFLINSLMENLTDYVFFKDRESRFIWISSSLAQSFGLNDPLLAKGKTDFDFFEENHAREAYADEQLIINTGKPIQREERLMGKNFYEKWISTIKMPLFDRNMNVIGTFGISRDITESKQASDAFKILSLRQEAILEAVPEILMEVDNNKMYRWANKLGYEFFGDDVIGKEASFYFEGDQDTYGNVQPLLDGTDEIIYVESWQRRVDGEKRLLGWWCRTLRDKDGKVSGMLSSAQDITDRREAEIMLEEERYLMQTLMNNLPDHIYFKDQESRFIRVNSAQANFLGMSDPEQVIGKTDFDFFTKKHAQQAFEDEKNILRTGKLLRKEERETHPDRPDTWVSTIKLPMYDKDGHVTGTFGISRDITERKKRELSNSVMYEITHGIISTNNLDELLEHIHRSISKVVYAENCYIALYNKENGIFSFPYYVDKEHSRPSPSTMEGSCTSYVFRNLEPVVLTKERLNILAQQNEISKRDSYPLSWLGVPLKSPSGTIGVLVLQHYDEENIYSDEDMRFLFSIGSQIAVLIERKQAEEEIRIKTEQLMTANNEKDKFFSIIAHDLRGPLSAFVDATQILATDIQSMPSEEITEITTEMKESAKNIYTLLENLLEWSRLKRGRIDFVKAAFNLKDKVSECLNVIIQTSVNKGIRIDVSIPEDIYVYADMQMFESTIRNLCTNAIKFTRSGGNINITAQYSGSSLVEIKVSDTGIGMSSDFKNKLFMINEKTNRPGTDGEPSTGLGLLLSKEFVEKNGGEIWVESEEGKGSSFYFTIPVKSNKK